VVIGGLAIGTVLALFVVPVVHTYTDDLANLVRAALGRTRKKTKEEAHV